jgi:hypothetical protein
MSESGVRYDATGRVCPHAPGSCACQAGEAAKVPVGTRVRYHGSVRHLRGEYEVIGYSDLSTRHDLPEEAIAEHWPDGIAYELWPVGVEFKFGNRDQAVYFVRRASFTVLEEADRA